MVDALIDDMKSLVDGYRSRDDPAGYFAAMYLGVTREVQRGLAAGRFSNPEQLERLTVTFANRYLAAAGSESPTASWAVAFDAAADRSVTIVQHLLLGMNAHINLDLGIACAEVAPGDAITSIRRDFDEINDVLAQLVDRVQASLSELAALKPSEAAAKIERHDAVVAGLGRSVAPPPWWSRAGLRVLRFTERSNVSEVIDTFDRIGA